MLRLPAGLQEIEVDAFAGSACEAVIVPTGCKFIRAGAFANCPNLKYVFIPQGVDVAGTAFSGSNLVIIDQQQ